MAELRDKVILFRGMSLTSFNTTSVTPIGTSNNGWVLSGGYAPTRTFNPDTANLAEFRKVIATLIADLYMS